MQLAPIFTLTGFIYTRVEGVGGIQLLIEGLKRAFSKVFMAYIVLRWIFRAPGVKSLQDLVFNSFGVGAFFQNVVLMHHVAKQMTVIELHRNLVIYFFG